MKKFRRWMIILFRVLVICAVIAGVVYALSTDDGVCKDVVINIESLDGDDLMTKSEVDNKIKRDKIIGKTFKEIDLLEIEQAIKKMPYVRKVNAVAGINGDLKINIVQHQPIARIINEQSEAMYMVADSIGLVKVSKNGSARVPIVAGKIRFEDRKMLKDLRLLLDEINKDEFMSAYVQQIVFEGAGRFSIVGLVGNHVVELGDVSNLQDKFARLRKFYDKGLSKAGWDKYSTISVEFDKQVVCR